MAVFDELVAFEIGHFRLRLEVAAHSDVFGDLPKIMVPIQIHMKRVLVIVIRVGRRIIAAIDVGAELAAQKVFLLEQGHLVAPFGEPQCGGQTCNSGADDRYLWHVDLLDEGMSCRVAP